MKRNRQKQTTVQAPYTLWKGKAMLFMAQCISGGWLNCPAQNYRIMEKDKAYQIVNRKDGTLVMDGLKSHKQAMWNLHNKVLKGEQKK